MSNILDLMIEENSTAKSLAAVFDTEEKRKEVYLKYLIISALEKASPCVETVNSAAFSHKFYNKTDLFDFYVNNNVFDLIILKPNTDELLFEVKQDDIHANLYGYVAARLDENLNNVEILGFFRANEYEKYIVDNKLVNMDLEPLSSFEDIEILDSQMTLDDVSDTFFELISGFFDETLDDEAFAELACLLYNSSELRGVFSEVGRFECICSDLKDNQELVRDDFLSVLAADGAEKLEEADETEEFLLEDLDITDEEPPIEILPEDTEEITTESEEESLDELVTNEESSETETETAEEPLVTDLDEISEEEISQELFENDEETEILELTEDENNTEDLNFIENDTTLEEAENTETENVVIADDADFEIDEADLDDIIDFNDEEISEDAVDIEAPVSSSSKLEEELHHLSLVEEEPKTPAPEVQIDEELLSILDSSNDTNDESVVVDDDELMSILGIDISQETEPALKAHIEFSETKSEDEKEVEENEANETSAEDERIAGLDELVESTPQKSGDLKLLFTEENPTSDESFKADEIQGSSFKKKIKKKSNVIILASVLATLAVVSLVVTKFNGNSNTDSDIASDTSYTQNNGNMNTSSQMPLPADDNMNIPDNAVSPVQSSTPSAQAPEDTKIVSSLAKDIKTGSAPVILKSVAWQVPSSISNDAVFSKYLQIAGKNIKMNLATDLLNTSDFAYNNKIKVSMKVKNNAPVRDVRIVESSGSKDVDDIVLQSIKQTLKYINSPVMSTDRGDREVVLVISI